MGPLRVIQAANSPLGSTSAWESPSQAVVASEGPLMPYAGQGGLIPRAKINRPVTHRPGQQPPGMLSAASRSGFRHTARSAQGDLFQRRPGRQVDQTLTPVPVQKYHINQLWFAADETKDIRTLKYAADLFRELPQWKKC